MSGPQIVVWPIESEYSYFADIGDAISEIGYDPFEYMLCEERSPDTPEADAIDNAIAGMLCETVGSIEGEAESRIRTSDSVQRAIRSLVDAMVFEAHRNKLWYPVGEVLTYTPELDEDDGA